MKGQKREVMRGWVGSGDKGMQVPAGATRGKDTPWKPPETLLQAGTLIPVQGNQFQTSGLQNSSERVNVYCFKLSICGNLLGWPQVTNISTVYLLKKINESI